MTDRSSLDRAAALAAAVGRDRPWDLLVVGGGATGAGVALDAAARGLDVLLLEGADFGSGTSSRSTKLVHGGVRYLQQGNVSLVVEALHERGRLRANAPHLVRDLAFVVPRYEWWEAPWYGIGLKVYDLLAGRYGFGSSRLLDREEALAAIPTLEAAGLRGGVRYHDGQFDDARLLIAILRTAAAHGAVVLNQAPVVRLRHGGDGLVAGAVFHDREGGGEHEVRARAVVNATGPFCDDLRRQDEPEAAPLIAPSQGVHLVLDRSFLPGEAAIMVPRTRDRRVMFAIPWRGRTLLGTTDTPLAAVEAEPRARPAEIAFLLETAAEYLARDPGPADVRSVFAGIRPLVAAGGGRGTAALSRDHTVLTSASGLITVAGGKWTTFRRMAEDVVDVAVAVAGLPERPCPTRGLRLHGWIEPDAEAGPLSEADPLPEYGSEAAELAALAAADPDRLGRLHPELPITGAQIVWAARHEMARTVEDALSRRTRALLLDAAAAAETAPAAAALLAAELGRDEAWQREQVAAFRRLAAGYRLDGLRA